MPRTFHVDDLPALAGREIGVSDWVRVDQDRIDRFANVTGDHQWVHTDPERAAASRFGATIAHGLLTLSLLPRLSESVLHVDGVRSRINYGYDRVRFPHPLVVGSRVRDRIVLDDAVAVSGGVRMYTTHTVEIDGVDRPACVAASVTHLVTADIASSRKGAA